MHQLHQYPDVCGMEVPTQPCQYESPGGISFDTSRSPALNEWVGCNLGRDFVGKPAILHLRPRLGSRPGFHPETAECNPLARAGALVRCSVSEVGLLT